MFSLEYIDFIWKSEVSEERAKADVIVLNYLLNWKISLMSCIAKMVIWTFSSDGTRGLASLCLKDLFFANQTNCLQVISSFTLNLSWNKW